jgi:hypothetical protein
MKTFTIGLLALAACNTAGDKRDPATQVADAAAAPLSDLNIVRAPIPPALLAARSKPYGKPTDSSCTGLLDEVRELDAVLGADLDTTPTALNPSLIERGVYAVGASAIGTVRGAAESVVPFRSWIRKLGGAEKYSKEVAVAISAGVVRRSFLKGWGDARGCAVPASPRR